MWQAMLNLKIKHLVALVLWTIFLLVLFVVGLIFIFSPERDTITVQHTQPLLIPGEQPNNIFWFIQITDLHLNHLKPHRTDQFVKFCFETLKTINPSLVLVTGDLTDSKVSPLSRSHQYFAEWKSYQDTIKGAGVFKKNFWLDLRGNHDCFSVPYYNHENNLYKQFSVAGSTRDKNMPHYNHFHKTSFGTYQFVSFDSCPRISLGRPFNFFGLIESPGLDILEHHLQEGRKKGVNQTIAIGHYPLVTIQQTAKTSATSLSLLDLFQEYGVLAYLSGHLHQLFGETLQSRKDATTLELELGDFMEHQKYRVMAYDHDLMSFVDTTLNQWPVILITNPKDGRYLSEKEPLSRQILSTHIRALVFSDEPIQTVHVTIADGAHSLFSAQMTPSPVSSSSSVGDTKSYSNEEISNFYVAAWDPHAFSDGKEYSMRVKAIDSDGKENEVVRPFILVGSQVSSGQVTTWRPLSLPRFSRALLNTDFAYCLRLGVLLVLVGLVITSLGFCLISSRQNRREPLSLSINHIFLHDTDSVLQRVDWKIKLLVCYAAMLLIGPWFMGPLLDDTIPVPAPVPNMISSTAGSWVFFFFWGQAFMGLPSEVMDGHWIIWQLSLDSFYLAFFRIGFVFVPWVVYCCLMESWFSRRVQASRKRDVPSAWLVRLTFVIRIIFPIWIAVSDVPLLVSMRLCYGIVALVLSPAIGWMSLLICISIVRYEGQCCLSCFSGSGDKIITDPNLRGGPSIYQ
eukprot:TRINITY_DN8155_c0_g1_i1.p1 TRINITY_DN8155_c0_g1~~TRINITY_DN8155_c0_g1_i1.p1  ORF type:complete len:738 (+),score=80.63 TRINITY_DN8155_c0_g1_i1:30-2243(+)